MDSLDVLRRMDEASRAIKEYNQSELSGHILVLLDSLAESYKADLADVDEAGLKTLQAKLRQTMAIRDVIAGSGQSPRA